MINDGQLEQMILERNTFELETINLKKELGVICKTLMDGFNASLDDGQKKSINVEIKSLIRKHQHHIQGA
tara:strand:+ start:1261 stop:1470 length:210 start_codon:yes stop_codon:yes gene_type:complete